MAVVRRARGAVALAAVLTVGLLSACGPRADSAGGEPAAARAAAAAQPSSAAVPKAADDVAADDAAADDPAAATHAWSGPQLIQPGVELYESTVERDGATVRVWLYVPEGATSGLPAVLIGPSGTPLFYGMQLSDGDRAEHLPWVEAGYAVIAYDIEGDVDDSTTDEEFAAAVARFASADFGVADARLALDLALGRPGLIDPAKVIAVGHSSAGGLALLVAAADARIAGSVAFAPGTDVFQGLDPDLHDYAESTVPGFDALAHDASAHNAVARMTGPVFLFHADDDRVVTRDEFDPFVADLTAVNPQVTVLTVPTGGHYESMIDQGLPAAIAWADALLGVGAAAPAAG